MNAEPKKPVKSLHVTLPRQLAIDARVHGNPVQQLARPALELKDAVVSDWSQGKSSGKQLKMDSGKQVVVFDRKRKSPDEETDVLVTDSGTFPMSVEEALELKARWLQPVGRTTTAGLDPHSVRSTWDGQFSFIEEGVGPDGKPVPGLRPPQIGAVYATLAHWQVTKEPATIVMPTGTGKTETMLALLLHQRFERLLVIVPNDALRTQIAEKFLTLGKLREFGIVSPKAAYPIVARLQHQLRTAQEARDVFAPANVVVTTMQVLTRCSDEAKAEIVSLCTCLFIDEAHHVSAASWSEVRETFASRRILQFTATPFRNDRKHVPGTVVFNYPLRKAQEENYFRPIKFHHVWEFDPDKSDAAIADKAVECLRADLNAGYDHLLMARADSIDRANEVIKAYATHSDLRPVIVHTRMKEAERRTAMAAIRKRASRVVVCVNMFGEGFDLPELKIAALHDVHKSLAVTLQYTGRFTRAQPHLGEAKMVANLADTRVHNALEDLYSESADWNRLLRELSESATGAHVEDTEFFEDFPEKDVKIALKNVTPKMSTIVYKGTRKAWHPTAAIGAVSKGKVYGPPAINNRAKVLAFVTREVATVPWGKVRDLEEVSWHLYLFHWDEERKLLFINSTERSTLHEGLAKAIIGDDCKRIEGEQVFRLLHGLNRLSLTNLGLKHTVGRARRFTMFVGNDVLRGLGEANSRDKVKSNIFGFGYRKGVRTGAGCSARGRLWSYEVAGTIREWTQWCKQVGNKLLDETISLDNILQNVVKYKPLESRPDAVPIAIDWSDEILGRAEETVIFEINGVRAYLYEVALELLTFDNRSPIQFRVRTETGDEADFEIGIHQERLVFKPIRGTATIVLGKKKLDLAAWLEQEPLTIFFHDRSLIIDNQYAQPSRIEAPFPRERLQTWDWTGTNIRRESQGISRDPDTIQYRVVQELLKKDYDIVFDDDDAGEAADVVAITTTDEALVVEFYHLKYSKGDNPGARIEDLYAVCGQAQKSISRCERPEALFDHLKQREGKRSSKKPGSTRFQRGDLKLLQELKWRCRKNEIDFRIFIVQPGLSKAQASPEQLELLAVTDLYLKETFEIPLTVITSE